MDDLVARWALGLLVSLAGGHVAAWGVLKLWRSGIEDKFPEIPGVPNYVIGLGERFFFTVVIANAGASAAVAMMVWLTVKMAANWNRPWSGGGQQGGQPPPQEEARRTAASEAEREVSKQIRRAMASLFAGLVSMTFALIGGLICAGWK